MSAFIIAMAEKSAAVSGMGKGKFSQLNGYLNNISAVVESIGALVAFMGILMLIRSFATDNAEARSRAIFITVTGGIITALVATVTTSSMSW